MMRRRGDIIEGIQNIAPNYGMLLKKVPPNVLNELKIQIDHLQNTNFATGEKYNQNLIGEIKNEYGITPGPDLINYLKYCNELFDSGLDFYNNYFTSKTLGKIPNFKNGIPLTMDKDCWVNFMKKHEYNPVHYHKGLVSWVIWYQIPYTYESEEKYSAKDSNYQEIYHGDFEFEFTHPAYGIQTLPMGVDKRMEGYIIMFPAALHHKVNPFFSSDDYRITVAGNFKIHEDKILASFLN